MAFADPALRVRRARLVGAALPADARERLQRRLGALAPAERGDLVLVRHLAARLPARVLERRSEDPDPAWTAPAARLHSLLAGARSPWHETTGPGTEAVRFADVAEWLACAAVDLLQGRIRERWWWDCRNGDAAGLVAAMWQAHPAELPAVLALLAQRRLAAAACLALPAPATLRRAVETCHGLPHREAADLLAAALARPELREIVIELQATALMATPEAAALSICGLALARAPAAWRGLLAEPTPWPPPAVPSHPAPRRLDARSRPPATDIATAPGIAEGSAHHRGQPAAPTGAAATSKAGAVTPPSVAANTLPATRIDAAAGAPAPTTGRNAGPDPQAPVVLPARQNTPRKDAPTRPPCPPSAAGIVPPANSEAGIAMPSPARPVASNAGPSPAPYPPPRRPQPPPADAAPSFAAAGIDSACGGLFHLLNMALALGLYADFSRPRDPGIALHPWDFLTLAGHRLLGRRFAADPLAVLLAALAGRPPELPPGCWAAAPDPDWSIPTAWLAAWPPGRAAWQLTTAGGRVALWHPAGFCVVDAAAGSAGVRDWRAVLDAAGQPLRQGKRRPQPLRHWPDWMARLAPFLRARLARATAWPARQAMTRLLWRPARIDRAPGRLDIVMSLAELPLPIRLAGLDRDPGWLPAAGCDLRYRFD